MLDIAFRMLVAGSLLYSTAFVAPPAEAGSVGRTLPRAMHPLKVEPCKASWPYLIRTCVA